MYEFETEFSVLSQDGYIEVSYFVDPDDGGIDITEVIWKQKHKTDMPQWHLTESVRRYKEWTVHPHTCRERCRFGQPFQHRFGSSPHM